MQFSERWLRTLVDPALDSEQLAHLLTMSGLEVEACEPVAPPFSRVVVSEVRAVVSHPHAERLKVCEVDVGQSASLTIVCGAPDVTTGMKAPCALVGARLPGADIDQPLEIRAASVRGVESQGMLCSARELGLSSDHAGLLQLDATAPVGADLREYLALDDRLFTIKLTPNRADCLSVLGLGRELSALTGARLIPPQMKEIAAATSATFPVKISDANGCGRFTGRVIQDVDARAATPEWLRQRLERAGQRSISALVDVTNYVMLELGRPLHVYDLDKLAEGIDVRFGRKGERLLLLNEQEVELDQDVLAITDASGPIGLAGIMGGQSTKADLDTRNVFLEAAFFFPQAIAGRARRYNFTSDASHRFERGVDFANNLAGIERATQLILEICGGRPGPVADTVGRLPERPAVRMRLQRAHRVIGVAVNSAQIAEIFTRLGLPFQREGADADEVFVVQPPSFRFDLEIEADLIEEVARVYGYDNIPAHPPRAAAVMRAHPETRRSPHQLRAGLAFRGYQEVINFSFVEPAWEADLAGQPQPIALLNPIASHLSVMRSSLMAGLVSNVRYNFNQKARRIRLFEIGRVFWRDAQAQEGVRDVAGVRQPMRMAAIALGPAKPEQWGEASRAVDFYDVKGDLEHLLPNRSVRFEPAAHPALHPGRSARVMLNGQVLGWLGELHPRWQQQFELPQAPVLFELDCEPLLDIPLPAYHEFSRLPEVSRDLAVVVPEEVPMQAVLDDLMAHKPALVVTIRLFDSYRGKGIETGKKSLAFRVLLQDTQTTLTDSQVDSAVQRLVVRLQEKFGGKLRD